MRQIGYLDLDEALQRLDIYMDNAVNTKPPRPVDLRKSMPRHRSEHWHDPDPHKWHLEFPRWDLQQMHGNLCDEERRIWLHDATYEDGYHYNKDGRICTIDGRVVH